MDEEHKLSSQEQREKMKQEFLKELKLRKQIMDKVKEAQRLQKISDNLEEVMKLSQISSDIDEFIHKIQETNQMAEAKIDIVLETLNTTTPEKEKLSLEENPSLHTEQTQQAPNAQNEVSKTLLEEEKKPFSPPADEKFTTKTIGDDEH